jgi:hypothetical protein
MHGMEMVGKEANPVKTKKENMMGCLLLDEVHNFHSCKSEFLNMVRLASQLQLLRSTNPCETEQRCRRLPTTR